MEESTVADVKGSGDKKLNPVQKFVKVFSDVFMPILPANYYGRFTNGD